MQDLFMSSMYPYLVVLLLRLLLLHSVQGSGAAENVGTHSVGVLSKPPRGHTSGVQPHKTRMETFRKPYLEVQGTYNWVQTLLMSQL